MALFLAAGLALLQLTGCAKESAKAGEPAATWEGEKREAVQSGEVQFQPPGDTSLVVVIQTNKGSIEAVLYPEYAPAAVENFCALAEAGYYDGTEFHRVVKDFVIQGGDATGTGASGSSIWGAPFGDEYAERLHHYAGALCSARGTEQASSHLSQFYIVAAPAGGIDEAAAEKMRAAGMREDVIETYKQAGGLPYLDYTSTVFGQVYAGMDVVDAIAAVPVDDAQRPEKAVVVESVTVSRPAAQAAAAVPPPASTPPVSSLAEEEPEAA